MMTEDRLSAILAASERGDTDFVEASQEYVTDLVAEVTRLTADRDELRALVREHFAAEAALCDVVERRARLYRSPSFSPHESQELERELAATVLRTDNARAALVAKVTP